MVGGAVVGGAVVGGVVVVVTAGTSGTLLTWFGHGTGRAAAVGVATAFSNGAAAAVAC